MIVIQRETVIWPEDRSRDEAYILGDETDIIGAETISGSSLIKLLFGDPYKTLISSTEKQKAIINK